MCFAGTGYSVGEKSRIVTKLDIVEVLLNILEKKVIIRLIFSYYAIELILFFFFFNIFVIRIHDINGSVVMS